MLHRFRTLLVLVVLASIALLAACGSSDEGGGASNDNAGAAGTDGKASEAVPADSLFFASVNVDQDSDAWKKLVEVGSRFPGWGQLATQFQQGLQETSDDGTSFPQDIQPWLGSEVGVAVTSLDLSTPSEPKPVVVGYAESTDDAKAAALVQKIQGATPLADYKGYKRWTTTEADGGTIAVGKEAVLFATSEAALNQAIDTREGAGAKLSDQQTFKDTLAQLPDDNLGVLYVDGPKLAQLATLAAQSAQLPSVGGGSGAAEQQQLTAALDQLRVLKGLGMSFGADDGGFRIRTATLMDEERAKSLGVVTDDFAPSLLDRAPATTLAYIGFHDLGPMLKRTIDQLGGQSAQVAQAISAFEAMTGASFDNEVVPLLSGEHGLYVAPGNPGPIPSVGLLLKPKDAAAGAATIRKLTQALVKELSASGGDAGVDVQDIPNGQRFSGDALSGLSVVWRQAGDVIAFSNDQTAGDEPSANLADSDKWKNLAKAAGVSDDVAALAYVDIPGILDTVRALGAGDELDADPQVAANLKPLGGLAVWGDSKDGGVATADIFLEVRAGTTAG